MFAQIDRVALEIFVTIISSIVSIRSYRSGQRNLRLMIWRRHWKT